MKHLRAVALSLLIVALTHAPAAGQEPVKVNPSDWSRGFNGFATICEAAGLEPRPPQVWKSGDPSRSVLVMLGDLSRSPVDLTGFLESGGSLLVACDYTDRSALRRYGIGFDNRDWKANRRSRQFRDLADCPLVTRFADHPVTRGLGTLVTNRPAILRLEDFALQRTLAWFPVLERFGRDAVLMAGWETGAGGRVLVLSDPSLFSNQMLIYGDNARLAWQALDWLRNPGRDDLLLVIDGEPARPAALDDTALQLPPPTREEVLEALRNLPPDKLVEFGNAMATVIEDEGLVNEFLATAVKEVPQVEFSRFLLLLVTVVAGVFLWYAYITRDTLVEQMDEENRLPGVLTTPTRYRSVLARQRATAARLLLDRFLTRSTGLPPQRVWPARFRLASTPSSLDHDPVREIGRACRRVSGKKPSWWNRNRLNRLEQRIEIWSQLHQSGELVYDAPEPSAN